VLVAAISKVRLPSVSGGYGTTDTFSDDRTDAIIDKGLAKDMPLLCERFRRRAVFKLLTPKFTDATENQFMEKSDPLTEKKSKFCYEGIHADTDSRCVLVFIAKKRLVFLLLSLGFLKRSRQKFYRITLSTSLCQVLSKSV